MSIPKAAEIRAIELLDAADIIVLTAVGDDGYPISSVMTKMKNEALKSFYFIAGKTSNKLRHFTQNPAACLCYYSPGGSVTLKGDVCLCTNVNILESLWSERLRSSFPNGIDDPNFCVLEFNSAAATLCFAGAVEHHNM